MKQVADERAAAAVGALPKRGARVGAGRRVRIRDLDYACADRYVLTAR
jgi:hypothetical protein